MILELKNVSLIIPNNPIDINNGYKADGEEVKLLHITVPKMSEYIKSWLHYIHAIFDKRWLIVKEM